MSIVLNGRSITIPFDTFEAREAAFNEAVGRLLPVRYQGPEAFWRDLRKMAHGLSLSGRELPAYITSNPRDCLAFGSPLQILAAAYQTARSKTSGTVDDYEEIGRRFGLEQVWSQPIRTLSGGETVRLALAKSMLAAGYCDRLIIASPFCWMSANHLPLLEQVAAGFAAAGKTVRILAMTDEDSRQPLAAEWLAFVDLQHQGFGLECRRLRIMLGTPINSVTANPVLAQVADSSFRLTSPCLVVGDNGQGKSLLAKALCGAMAIEGMARIASTQNKGRPRLLFQDVAAQTLMRTLPDIALASSRNVVVSPDRLFGMILASYKGIMTQCGAPYDQLHTRETAGTSMAAVKTMLIAVRLAQRPSALILDEPDWGLSRTAAIALVLAVIQQAHALGIPVMIISHKPWWHPLAASQVKVTRQPVAEGPLRFSIHLRKVDPSS